MQALVVLGASGEPQTRAPDATALAGLRDLIQTGRIEQAQEQLKQFDASAPLVVYSKGLAFYHADDSQAIETLMPIVPQLTSGSTERREAEQVLGLALHGAGRLAEAVPDLRRPASGRPTTSS